MLTDQLTTISAHIARLKDEILARKGSFLPDGNPFIRSVALWRAARADEPHSGLDASDPARSRVQVRAAYLYELVSLADIRIEPEWRLVGNHLPTTQVGFEIPEADHPDHIRAIEALGGSAGYSQMFNLVPKDLQDHIIARTKHRC